MVQIERIFSPDVLSLLAVDLQESQLPATSSNVDFELSLLKPTIALAVGLTPSRMRVAQLSWAGR